MKVSRRLLFIGVMWAAGTFASCAGESTDALETRIPVATQGTVRASPTGTGAAATSTVGGSATVSQAGSPSPLPSPVDTATVPATVVNPARGATAAPQPTPAPRVSAVSLTFRAANLAFDKTAVRVPVGATITATLQNDDVGQEHNLTFGLPGLPHGDSCKGPCVATQVFKVEVAGSYSFLCTIHDMFGTFIVDP